jgi:hypothetical protein
VASSAAPSGLTATIAAPPAALTSAARCGHVTLACTTHTTTRPAAAPPRGSDPGAQFSAPAAAATAAPAAGEPAKKIGAGPRGVRSLDGVARTVTGPAPGADTVTSTYRRLGCVPDATVVTHGEPLLPSVPGDDPLLPALAETKIPAAAAPLKASLTGRS